MAAADPVKCADESPAGEKADEEASRGARLGGWRSDMGGSDEGTKQGRKV